MNDDDFNELFKKPPERASGGTSWRDVASEIGALGKTFGEMVRSAWENPDAQGAVDQLRQAMQGAIEDLNDAAGSTAETRQARDQLARLAESIRDAAGRASDEVRPQLLDLLRRANTELRRAADLDK
jgi:hypothetical protein